MRLKISGGEVLGSALMPGPFHEQAVGQATVVAQELHALVALDTAAIIVVGNVQALVQAALDPPALGVEVQPSLALSLWGGALEIKATSSSRRPWVCRRSRAACMARGKPTFSADTAAVRMPRFSSRP